MDKPKNHRSAIACGSETYCTGKPCKNGHFADRRTANLKCVDCIVASRQPREVRTVEEERALNNMRMRAWRANNKEHARDYMKHYMRDYRKRQSAMKNAEPYVVRVRE